jgi:hypothetical protein
MHEKISDPGQLGALNNAHVNRAGKWYQMCAGTSSQITLFEDGIIHLRVHVPEKHARKVPEQLIHGLAQSWRQEKSLGAATGYSAHVYVTRHPSGFLVAPDKGTGREAMVKAIVAHIKTSMNPGPSVFVRIVEGGFDDE